ncbi:hypothetical protein LTR66_008265 [Elasticomyces elasticus]|nr:hypothetical protein LTR66_008265 [Elasticomyces elasticus]KAK4987938.1 hypothetical protein LTR50_004275 [Elasticomyces elasticus]
MAENNTAPSLSTANPTNGPDKPGMPYYEDLRNRLRGSLQKKRQLDEQLAALEDSIYKLEGSYLEDTTGAGNIVRGFDGWVKGVVVVGGGDKKTGPRARVRDEDRIFSRSSVGWMRQSQESPAPPSGANTPSIAPTPASSFAPGPQSARDRDHATPSSMAGKAAAAINNNTKKKKAPERDEEDEKPPKRGKISYGRD